MDLIDKLCERISNSTFSLNAMDDLFGLIEEIEAEIGRDYIKLPVDADGVPIHVGDRVDWHGDAITIDWIEYDSTGECYVGKGAEDGKIPDALAPNECRHVKQRTIEDVLRDFRHGDLTIEGAADELRELLGGDAR